MGIDNVRYAVVNLSTTKIPVYEKLASSQIHTGGVTVGGKVVGHIHQYEYYVILPNSSYAQTSFRIYFLDGSGTRTHGYIETSPGTTLGYYAWNAKQYPYHYYNSDGSKLVASSKATINGSTFRVFTVNKKVTYRNSSGDQIGSLAKGTKIACNSSSTGKSYNGHMIFKYKKNSSGKWVQIASGLDYVFVNLDLISGTMPSNRSIW